MQLHKYPVQINPQPIKNQEVNIINIIGQKALISLVFEKETNYI